MSAEPVLFSIVDGVGILTLNNPPLNLVTLELMQALSARLEDAAARSADLRALIVTGAGGKAFCAGSDLRQFGPLMVPGKAVSEKLGLENAVFSRVAHLGIPTIAAVDGLAFGGGLELACCCDLIVVSEGARLCLPEVKLGLIPGSGGTLRLTRRIGVTRAKELMLLGIPIDAPTALAWGLVNRIASNGRTLDVARELVAQLDLCSPNALRLCKTAIDGAFDRTEEEAIAQILDLSDEAFSSLEAREGVRAFMAKEAPAFRSKGVAA